SSGSNEPGLDHDQSKSSRQFAHSKTTTETATEQQRTPTMCASLVARQRETGAACSRPTCLSLSLTNTPSLRPHQLLTGAKPKRAHSANTQSRQLSPLLSRPSRKRERDKQKRSFKNAQQERQQQQQQQQQKDEEQQRAKKKNAQTLKLLAKEDGAPGSKLG